MTLLRSIALFICMLVFTPFWATLCFLAFPFMSAAKRYELARVWNKVVVFLAEKICGIQYEVRGMENIQTMLDQPVILLSKHQSAWETIAFLAFMPKQLCFVF